MATTINASTSNGLIQTADTSGVLALQAADTTIASVSSTGVAVTGLITATGSITATGQIAALKSETAQATTSGTTKDFTGIPSWAKQINVIFNEVAISGSDNLLVVLGTTSSLEITGYISTTSNIASTFSSTTAFDLGSLQTALSGVITFSNISGNIWIANVTGKTGTTRIVTGGGSKTLASALTRLQIKLSGTNTFATGSVNILYE